ncbi:MAG: hypothetical protein AAF961_00950 [Planctomycetota bacterium]
MKLRICLALLTLGAAAPVQAAKPAYNLPPAARLLEPGPGVGGPGPGVIAPGEYGPPAGGGVMPAQGYGAMGGCIAGACMAGGGISQIAFLGVEGGEVAWDVTGQCTFDSVPLVMPGRQNFPQSAIYRLKLSNIPQRPGVELYPTLEIAPVTPRTDAFLAHSPIPVQFTDEDLDQVQSGNFVTKVIYLPDPEFQELALAGVETLVSTRLDPGVDPIREADNRGAILAIVRIGNLDLQLPNQMMSAADNGVQRAQYCGPGGGCYDGGATGPVGGYGTTPIGMPTSAFSPTPSPPHMVSGMNGPQYGMPYVGTPIGLPGPPHVPLGHGASLVKHTMKNRTRILMPPPVHHMKMSVKQRPGMNYPRPVNRVHIDETPRAGFNPCSGTEDGCCESLKDKIACKLRMLRSQRECEEVICD